MMRSLSLSTTNYAIVFCGVVIAGAFVTLASYSPRLGTSGHLLILTTAAAAYGAAVVLLFRGRGNLPRAALGVCIALGLAARAPLVVKPAGRFDDTHRYIWDARLQRAGLN